jgi:hypothetical protein
VTVTTVDGTSATSSADQFTYAAVEPSPGEVLVEPPEATQGGFKLKGKLNPEHSQTSYYFLYRQADAVECEDLEGCGTKVGEGGPLSGDTQQTVTGEVTGLTAGTEYVYWLIARNAAGAVVRSGNRLTFTARASKANPLGGEEAPRVTAGNGQSGAPIGPGGSSLVSPLVKISKPKVLTRAQKLDRALNLCAKKPRRKRAACRKQARKKYGQGKQRTRTTV